MIINIWKDAEGKLSDSLIFTCPLCGRTFNHNDYEFPARWEDAIRKHLIRAHGGKRIGHNLIELPSPHDDEHSIQGAGLVVGCSTAQGPQNRDNLQHNDDSSSHHLFSEHPVRFPSLEESPEDSEPSGAVLNGTSGDSYDYWSEGGEE